MSKFEVGDRVKHKYFGEGTVKSIYLMFSVAVEFDRDIGGHACNGTCKDHHGWYCSVSTLTKLRKVSPRKNETKTTFDGASSVGTVNKLEYVQDGKKVMWIKPEKKKRPAYWITTFDDRIALMGRGKVLMTTGNFYSNTSRRNQQAKRWAKALGIEVRK